MEGDLEGVSIAAAAAALGISADAVRKRLARGTLAGSHVGRKWMVYLDAQDAKAEPGPERPVGDLERRLIEVEAELAAVRSERDYLRQVLAASMGTQKLLAERTVESTERAGEPRSKPWWKFWERESGSRPPLGV